MTAKEAKVEVDKALAADSGMDSSKESVTEEQSEGSAEGSIQKTAPNSQKVTEEAKNFVEVDKALAADSEGLTKVKQWIL